MRGMIALGCMAAIAACGQRERVVVSPEVAASVARPVVAARVPVGLSVPATQCIVAAGARKDLLLLPAGLGLDPTPETVEAVLRMAREREAEECLEALGIDGLPKRIAEP